MAFVLAAGLALVAAAPAVGLDPTKKVTQYTVDSWDSEDGLPATTVTSIAQTPDGYLWLATQAGIARFNGSTFRVFDRGSGSLADDSTNVLFTDRQGTLWAGFEDAAVVRRRGGAFEPVAGGSEPGLVRIITLCQGSDGTIWAGGYGVGVTGVRPDGSVVRITRKDGLPTDDVRALLEDAEGRLWIGTDGGGLCLREGETLTTYTTADGLPVNDVIALAEAPAGTIWVGTHGGGVATVRHGRIAVPAVAGKLPSKIVPAILGDPEGNVWLATYAGLCRARGGDLDCIDRASGLSSAFVRTLYLDLEGSLWVGTLSGGIDRIKDGSITTYTVREGLPVNGTWSVMEDRRHQLWVGTNGGGLCRLLPDPLVVSTAQGLTNDTVLALAEAEDGTIWVGTRRGLNAIRGSRVASTMTTAEGLPSDFVRALHADSDGTLWVGTRAGLCRLAGGQLRTFGRDDGLADLEIRHISRDRTGTLWVGTNAGGVSLLVGGRFVTLTEKEGLADNFVTDVLEIAPGDVWVATDGGLSRLADGRIQNVSTAQGLPDNEIYRILGDDRGRLWMSSSRGIFAVGLADLEAAAEGREERVGARLFGTSDGMLTVECNGGVAPAGWRAHDGRLWFPTGEGVAAVDPGALVTNERAPTVAIESLEADGAEKPVDAGPLRLGPGVSSLELTYAALSLREPRRVRYRYILKGFDRTWTSAGHRRTAYYTNVPPGSYSFLVTGSNDDGVWSQVPAELSIELRPHFYQTTTFHVVWIVGLLAVGIGTFALRLRRHEAREEHLERLVDERTGELEEANRRLEALANVDGVTEIPNRRYVMEILEREWRRHRRDRRSLAVLMVDIDAFKAFNDTRGHLAGDDCLRRVAATISGTLHRPGDVAARYGGDEFIVVLAGTGADGAAQVAERILASVAALESEHPSSAVSDHLTVSIGVAAAVPGLHGEPSELVTAADRALYAAKARGRNRVSAQG